MAKPSKSQNPEFLANRRKAIADRARERRQQGNRETLGASSNSSERGPKVAGPVNFAATPPPQN
ncbi:MAG: hypothetical protein ACRD21_03650 [Vicinamibacteria bacterium]